MKMHSSSTSPDPICEPCLAGKQHHHAVPKLSRSQASRPLELVHMDVKGPLLVATPEGYHYWIVFVCDTIRLWVLAFLQTKDEAFKAFKTFKAYAENILGICIGCIRNDKGREFIGTDFLDFLKEHGISWQHTEPDEPNQNGVVEQPNRTIAEAVTSMLFEAKLHQENHPFVIYT